MKIQQYVTVQLPDCDVIHTGVYVLQSAADVHAMQLSRSPVVLTAQDPPALT